jgi:CheY-like chemotaxis protein
VLYLLVDKDSDFEYIIKTYLEMEGHQVVTATASAAFRLIEEFEFDGYLMDSCAITPDLDALLLQKKKGLLRLKPITVFWSSGALRGWPIRVHCDYFLLKPFSIHSLSRVLKLS